MKLASAIGAAGLVLTLASCGSAPGPGTVVTQATPTRLAPLADDTIVWQVLDGPGFTSLEYALSVQPTITVYADGRVLVQDLDDTHLGQTPIQFQEGQLTQQQVDDLRRAADESGLFTGADIDFGSPGISDAGTTTVTAVDAAGDQVSVEAYALGSDNGVDAQQQESRRRLGDLVQASLQTVPDTTPMTPTRLAVIGLDGSGGGPAAPAAEWTGTPHDELFDGQGDLPCALLPKGETADVYAAALDNDGHHWRDATGRFFALVKVVLPGTPPCPS